VRYKKVCETCDEELKKEDIERAVFIGGECIKFSNKEIESMLPMSSKTMEILGFCDPEQIQTVSLAKPYYLGTESPKKGGVGKSFQLLKKAMAQSGKVAVVKWILRTTEHLGMLIPEDEGFLLKLILYHEQVRSPEELEIIEANVEQDLLEKGLRVVEKMTFDFDWTAYNEEYTQRVRKLLEKKAMGEEITPEEIKPAETRSLEAELERMLEIAAE
jgi:DNA end-binding protein Ku